MYSLRRYKMEVCAKLHASVALPLANHTNCPLCRRMDSVQSWSGRFGDKYFVPPSLLVIIMYFGLYSVKLYNNI